MKNILIAVLIALAGCPFVARAATFTNSARIEINDPTGALSWNPTTNALTVSCWFKLSIPTGANLTESMVILANRRGGSQNDAHSYWFQFNVFTGNIEFSSRGSSGLYTNTLIERPYLERWYHVAVTRQADFFSSYIDGRSVSGGGGSAGTTSGDGLSIGGIGNGQYLYGEVQEVAIYQSGRDQEFIVGNMFQNQPTNDPNLFLQGYYKLGFSTNATDQLKNFANSPVPAATTAGSGIVAFEETNQAGEQSAFDSRKNGGRDALAPLSGAFSWTQTALSRPTPGIAFDFRFGYSSGNAGVYKLNNFDPYAPGPMGKGGWRHTFEIRVLPSSAFSPLADADTIGLLTWDGAIETWDKDLATGEYKPRDKEYKGEFLFTSTNCQWITPERLVYSFKLPNSGQPSQMRGRLLSIRDFNNNAVQIRWNETSAVITQVVDTASAAYDFKYAPSGPLTNISFQNWVVNFGYDSSNRLTSKIITNTSGIYSNVNTSWQFAYGTNSLLERIIDPRGNTNLFVQYDKYGRKTNEIDAISRTNRTEYGVPGKRQLRHTDPAGFTWLETYDRKGHLLAQQDPLGHITSHTYDEAGNRTSVTEPLGWKTTYGYDDRANLIASTNALGEISRWTFHPFFNKAIHDINPVGWTNFYELNNTNGNLQRHFDDLGTLVSYTYATNGLVLTSADANNHVTRSGYDTNGFLTSKTDPATNTWTYTVNDVGWKLGERTPLGDLITLTLDLNGNAVRTVDQLNRTFTKTHDANGNVLTVSDGKGQLTRHFYDVANQKTSTVDRAGNTNVSFYSNRGKLERVTDPLGNSSTNYYDAANRLERVSNALGFTTTNQFDDNGNVTVLIDQVGQRWSKTYDRLNRVIGESDPQGDTKRTTFDSAGRIKQVTTPNGFPSLHMYDGRGRLTKWVDAENFEWLYGYDGVGNITNITDALNGHYVMEYGLRNERILERNQDAKVWHYAYDELLRLQLQVDPNGVTRTPEYDAANRLLSVTFNTGRKNILTYDDNDNPRTVSRRQNNVAVATTSFSYDVLDRVETMSDPHGKAVGYGFDLLGRITSITYPGSKVLQQRFDAIGRMTNQTDWAGRQMIYEFDNAGRLTRRTYPNGVVQNNTFDNAGRITGLGYAAGTTSSNSINVALIYAYDRNGNKVGGGEKGTFAWPIPSLTDEKARYTAAGRLIDRDIEITNQVSHLTYSYDASGNMTNAASGAQSWTLTYDEDNRTTSIAWTNAPLNDVFITNRYDALGRRIAKTADGITTRYVFDLAGSMERTLCDTDGTGAITAYYIHGPDLCYKVDATNSVVYFHADAQANIIALSGTNGVLLTQYAYTPYGRSLGSSNLQILNPYLFVGAQGVMEELPGLYFMRARYYSAEAGVFLSTDPVKKIGPGWRPTAYAYGNVNPLKFTDPKGEFALTLQIALLTIIKESISIHYDILIRGESVTLRDLGARYAKAAATGAATGALLEFGGGFFAGAGSLGQAGMVASKGLINIGGNALEKGIAGKFDFEEVLADSLIDNVSDFVVGKVGKEFASKNLTELGKTAFEFSRDVIATPFVKMGKDALGSPNKNMTDRTVAIATPKAENTEIIATKPAVSSSNTRSSTSPGFITLRDQTRKLVDSGKMTGAQATAAQRAYLKSGSK